MFIKNIFLENFRGLPQIAIELHKRLNVFIGNNGAGKSSFIDFLAIMISQCRLLSADNLHTKITDICNGEEYFSGKICCEYKQQFIFTEYTYGISSISSRFFENTTGNFDDDKSPHGLLWSHYSYLKDEEIPFSRNYPLVVFYPTNRAILEIPERIRGFKPALHPFDALENALSSTLDFRSFIALFRQSEQAQEKNKKAPLLQLENEYVKWQSKQIDAVNRAIHTVVPEFSTLHVTQKPFRTVIKKNSSEYDFLQLSDGEKCLIALLGDLAQRLAIANPTLENPLEGEGIILIDEIELHLHPKWQRMIVPRLLETFPNCQFIVTSHSPQVLGEIEDTHSIWILEEGKEPYHPQYAYGLTSSEALDCLMGAESRNTEVTTKLERIDRLIDDEDFDVARAAIRDLVKKTGKIPAIYGANSYLTMMGQEQVDIEG